MKLDRLLSRIRAALQGYASEFEQRALAAEYANLCAKTSERIEQVVPLIRQGQDFPALQIAESAPPVLDLVRQLSFAEAEKWRAFCLQHGLPAARPFDERSVNLVNQLYGKKISETHPLYREYRQAIRTRHDDEALRVLQSIRRVNPDDANAHAEFARLAHKLFERRSVELAAALGQNDTPRVLALMESVEADDLPGREQDSVWQQAKKFREEHQINSARGRSVVLAAELHKIRGAGRWRDALPLLAEWDLLRGQFNFTLPPDVEQTATGAREWASTLLAGVEQSEERKKMWRDLGDYVNRLACEDPEKKTARTLAGEVAELAAQSAMLAKEAEGGGDDGPPPELSNRLRDETTRLRAHLLRRRLRAAGIAAAAGVVLAVVVAIAWWLHHRAQARQTDLAAIQQHFKDGATKALAATLKDYDSHFSGPEADPVMDALLTQARDFVNSHQAVVDRFDKELAQINESAANPSPSQVKQLLGSLDTLEQETSGLGADDAQRGKAAVQNLRVRLMQHLSHEQDSRAARLADIIKRTNEVLDGKLAGSVTAEAAQPVIADAKKIFAESDSLPPDPAAASPAEDIQRTQLDALGKKLDDLAAAARDALAARAQLSQATTLDDYHGAILSLAKNILPVEPSVTAAHALFEKNPDWADAAQRILLPGDPDTWAFLKQVGKAHLLPAEGNQKEDIAFDRLTNDNVLVNTYRADLVTYVEGAETKRESVALAGPPAETHNKIDTVEEFLQEAKKINADGTVSGLSARWVQFTGKQPEGQKLENVALTPESQLVARVRGAYSRDRNTIAQPLLRVLDDIRGDGSASPILKAYLEQEIFQIMQNRPRDWGLFFSPGAQADEQELSKITGAHLRASDWLFPAPNSRLLANLKAFYEQTAATSYFDEAETHLQALLKKHTTPLKFAGYVDLDGTPHASAPAGATLWGLDNSGNWVALYHTAPGGQPTATGNTPPARLTPLVYPDEN